MGWFGLTPGAGVSAFRVSQNASFSMVADDSVTVLFCSQWQCHCYGSQVSWDDVSAAFGSLEKHSSLVCECL